MQVIDLTIPLDEQTPLYPGDPAPAFAQVSFLPKEGWNERRLTFNSHFGTHIDAPAHMLPRGRTLDQFPPEAFVGEALVLDVRGQREIRADLSQARSGDIVLLCTGRSALQRDRYFELAPSLSRQTAEALVKKGVKMVGMDTFSPDGIEGGFPIHHLLLGEDILILENLTGLEPLVGKRILLVAAPLKLSKADGAPCRVFALLT